MSSVADNGFLQDSISTFLPSHATHLMKKQTRLLGEDKEIRITWKSSSKSVAGVISTKWPSK